MAFTYSKGWYVSELKKLGVREIKGKKLESYRLPILANEYRRLTEKHT